MKDSLATEQKSISIPSMSIHGDSLYLSIKRGDMEMIIGIEDDVGSHSAYFDREQQTRIRDFLNEVLA